MGLFNFLTGMATGMWDFRVINFKLIEYIFRALCGYLSHSKLQCASRTRPDNHP